MPACGRYAEEKAVDPQGPFAICPHCGYRHPFLQLPLFVLTGASGSGKTTVALRLAGCLTECVTLETDILWCQAFDHPEDDYQDFRNLWLRLAKNIGQSGRPVVLAGSAVPNQFERCPERHYFAAIHYLALVCDEGALTRRLVSRPDWRRSADPDFVERMIAFNDWLRTEGAITQPPIEQLDTTDRSPEATVQSVANWVRARLSSQDAASCV